MDPFALRAKQRKGKKALTALVDAYIALAAALPVPDRASIVERIRRVTAVTEELRFHDMNSVPDLQFKQDATSYLRLAYLMEQAGLNTTLYRQQIRMVEPRLNRHMSSRGVHQRMAFAWYYEHFGLTEPFPLAKAYASGVIAGRRKAASMSLMEAYDLTHEVFVPYRYGERRNCDFFSTEDKSYLRQTLEYLIQLYITKDDPDLTAELVSCMAYLNLKESGIYRTAIDYLLDAQNPNGSWGSYESLRERYGSVLDADLYLHSVLVAIDALVSAFEPVSQTPERSR